MATPAHSSDHNRLTAARTPEQRLQDDPGVILGILADEADKFFAADAPHVTQAQDGEASTEEVQLYYERMRKGTHPSDLIQELRPYKVSRHTHATGKMSYSLGYPSSRVARRSEYEYADRRTHYPAGDYLSWDRQEIGGGTYTKKPSELNEFAVTLQRAKAWDPATTAILTSERGDRLVKRTVLTAVGQATIRLRRSLRNALTDED